MQLEYNKRYPQNPEIKREYQKEGTKKKVCEKVENFLLELKQEPYYICSLCHQILSTKFFQHEKYHILIAELCHPVRSFDEKFYMCETFYKHLY